MLIWIFEVVTEHPFASEIVQVYVPADNPERSSAVGPLNQTNV